MSTTKYYYKPLSQEAREIRILHIQPGTWDEVISCTLHTASLDSLPIYQTLSYVWGDHTITLPIMLHGYQFQVTTNLFAALRRLRCESVERVIWIDALCINQEDLDERSQQVAMMGDIYRQCSSVIAWLGDGPRLKPTSPTGLAMPPPGLGIMTDPSKSKQQVIDTAKDMRTIEGAMSVIQPYLNAGDFSKDVEQSLPIPNPVVRDILEAFVVLFQAAKGLHVRDVDRYLSSDNQALHHIVSAPYWTRVWVIQEVILPPVATVYFGPVGVPLDILYKARKNWREHTFTCCNQFQELSPSNKMLNTPLRKAVQNLDRTRDAIQRNFTLDLQWLLRTHMRMKSRDARDKIFALLSLVNLWVNSSPIIPNYHQPLEEVLKTVATKTLMAIKDDIQLPNSCLISSNYPSWIANWGGVYSQSQELECNHMLSDFAATSGSNVDIQVLPQSSLMLNASLADTVEAVRQVMRSYSDTTEIDVSQVQITTQEILQMEQQFQTTFNPVKESEDWGDACWRAVCGDLTITDKVVFRRVVDADKQIFKLWLEYYAYKNKQTRNEDEIASVNSFDAAVLQNVHNRRFFFTRKGHIGIGPCTTQAGDDVYVINGSCIPHILRRVEVSDSPSSTNNTPISAQYPKFRLVGSCFMHGIMDGEASEEGGGEKATPIILC